MPDHLNAPDTEALRRVLGGSYVVSVEDDVTTVCTTLPAGCPAAAARVDGHLWIVIDLDKPMAIHHARAMINDHRASCQAVDLGDDDLDRDWQLQSALLPLPRPASDPPLPITPQLGRWAAMAATVITGASLIVNQYAEVVTAGLA